MDFLLNNKEHYNILWNIVQNVRDSTDRVSSGIKELSHKLQIVPKRLIPKLKALEYRWLVKRKINDASEGISFEPTHQGKEMIEIIEYFKQRSLQEIPLRTNF
jgi:DNA-binding MarR family transcriptional regulator